MIRLCAIWLIVSLGSLHAAGDVLWVASAIASRDGKTASALQEVEPSVERDFGLRALKLEKEKKWNIAVGEGSTFEFENGFMLRIDCESMDASRYRLAVEMADPQGRLLTTTIEAAKRVPLILAGPEEKGRRQLFVVLVR